MNTMLLRVVCPLPFLVLDIRSCRIFNRWRTLRGVIFTRHATPTEIKRPSTAGTRGRRGRGRGRRCRRGRSRRRSGWRCGGGRRWNGSKWRRRWRRCGGRGRSGGWRRALGRVVHARHASPTEIKRPSSTGHRVFGSNWVGG